MARTGLWFHRPSAERFWSYGLNLFGAYAEEIMNDYGLPCETFSEWETVRRSSFDLVVVAHAPENEETARLLWEFAESGGVVVSYAGIGCLARKLGCREGVDSGSGYAELPPEFHQEEKLKYLRAVPWLGAENPPVLQTFRIGKGRIERWTVDIPYTIVGLQQGTAPVLKDGAPAPDGSAEVDEGIWKADDGCVQDWTLDRERTSAGSPYFHQPYADLWKDAMVGHLIRCMHGQGLALPFLGFWPEPVSHVAMISHDSDLNEDEHAASTLEALETCGIQSTWCIIEPGYSPSMLEKIRLAGHELAFHYNALEDDGGEWSAEAFNSQLKAVKEAAGVDRIVSNKNHYTRLEGWGELFRWCEASGIEADQTRGPSKRGNVGFPFGTCRPYRPIAWSDERNRLYEVLEIGFLTQDLDHGYWSDLSVAEPLLDRSKRVQGVAHFLFHQVHIHGLPAVREAMTRVVEMARERGFVFWTSEQVSSWHKARRSVRIRENGEGTGIVIDGGMPLSDLVVWIPAAEDGSDTERRFGVPCRKQVMSWTERSLS